MIATPLLDRLEHVRSTGPDRWLARCPAHEDRRASLSVRATDERVLVHCFAGCSVPEVVAAVGIELSDLFPPKSDQHFVRGTGRRGRRIPAIDTLHAVSLEADLVVICAGRVAHGEDLSEGERQRLLLAASRIGDALIEAGAYAR